jgi:hypothetical protein
LARIGASGTGGASTPVIPFDEDKILTEVDHVFFANGIIIGNPTGILLNDAYQVLIEE